MAVADGDSHARRRRFCPASPGLATGTSWSHVAVSGCLPVYACAEGTVTVSGPVAGRGVISIRHSAGGRDIWSTYLPVMPTVAVGEHVHKGDVIGLVEGDSQTLHWGAKTARRTYVDPIRMTIGHPRLLPWDGR